MGIEGFTIRYGSIWMFLDKLKNYSRADGNQWFTNNNVYLYYPLETNTDSLITDSNLVNQLNKILNDNLYEGENKITITGNDLAPTIEFDYVKE